MWDGGRGGEGGEGGGGRNTCAADGVVGAIGVGDAAVLGAAAGAAAGVGASCAAGVAAGVADFPACSVAPGAADPWRSGACGNGTRCVADLLSKENNDKEIILWTSSGSLKSKIQIHIYLFNFSCQITNSKQFP